MILNIHLTFHTDRSSCPHCGIQEMEKGSDHWQHFRYSRLFCKIILNLVYCHSYTEKAIPFQHIRCVYSGIYYQLEVHRRQWKTFCGRRNEFWPLSQSPHCPDVWLLLHLLLNHLLSPNQRWCLSQTENHPRVSRSQPSPTGSSRICLNSKHAQPCYKPRWRGVTPVWRKQNTGHYTRHCALLCCWREQLH